MTGKGTLYMNEETILYHGNLYSKFISIGHWLDNNLDGEG